MKGRWVLKWSRTSKTANHLFQFLQFHPWIFAEQIFENRSSLFGTPKRPKIAHHIHNREVSLNIFLILIYITLHFHEFLKLFSYNSLTNSTNSTLLTGAQRQRKTSSYILFDIKNARINHCTYVRKLDWNNDNNYNNVLYFINLDSRAKRSRLKFLVSRYLFTVNSTLISLISSVCRRVLDEIGPGRHNGS